MKSRSAVGAHPTAPADRPDRLLNVVPKSRAQTLSTALPHRVHYIDCQYLEKGRGRREVTPLGRVYAFPTTIRIDRKGKVRKIYIALCRPVTGDQFEEFKTEFTTGVEQLLTEI